MAYYSCSMIEQMYLTFSGRIDEDGSAISLCCESDEEIPKVPFAGTPEETLRSIVDKWNLVLTESKKYAITPPPPPPPYPRSVISYCSRCPLYRKAEWKPDGLIHQISLGVYPSPCQCHCIYCHAYDKPDAATPNSRTAEAYNHLFELLEMVKQSNMLAPNFMWQVTCGEISIHPYKERFLDLVHGRPTMFFTNSFKYDEGIAQHLHDHPYSQLFLSMDAGTPETWKKVKGADNFEQVTSNLVEYYHATVAEGQIRLKYIVLPGINDTWEDYVSFVNIAKLLKAASVQISRDYINRVSMSPEERTVLVSAAAYLLALCKKSGVPVFLFDLDYTIAEREQMQKFADEILQRGLFPG